MPASAPSAPISCSPAAPSSMPSARAFPCRRLRVADRGLREGMLVQMMREDGVWGRRGDGRRDDARAADAISRSGSRSGRAARCRRSSGSSASSTIPMSARAKREGFRSPRRLQADRDRRQASAAQDRRDGWSISAPRPAAGARWRRSVSAQARAADSVVAIDLLDDGADCRASSSSQLDFLDPHAPDAIKALLGGPADVVLSDMAANATGHRKTDHLRIMALAEAAADFAREVLAPGGAFLCKVLQGGTEATLLAAAQARFRQREAREALGEPGGLGGALSPGDRVSRPSSP